MDEFIFTMLMLGFAIMIFVIRYLVPIGMIVIGGILLKKGKKMPGYAMIGIGILAEVVSVLIKVNMG